MIGYNHKRLLKVAESRGYRNEVSVVLEVQRMFALKDYRTATNKVREGIFTFDESFVLASFFEMTPKEYAGVFLDGLFRNMGGHFVCYVDDPDRFIREKKERRRRKREEAEAQRKEREAIAREINDLSESEG